MKAFATKLVATLLLGYMIISTPCQSISTSCPQPPPEPKCPPPPSPNPEPKCQKDALQFGVCTRWLGMVSYELGTKPSPECCTLLQGISDLEAAMCLCTAFKVDLPGLHLKLPVAISMVLSGCQKKVPKEFKC